MGTIIGGDKSFRRQETEDKWVPLPFTPPLLCCIFTTCYYWGICVCMLVVLGYCIICQQQPPIQYIVSSGGYLFFLKFFWESNKRELSKTINNLLSKNRAIGDNYQAKTRHPITIVLFQNGRTGGGCGHGVGYCLLSFVSRMIYVLFNSYFLSIYFFNRKLFLKNTCIKT